MNAFTHWQQHTVHACLFLGGASALVWPPGYTLAPLLLSLLGLYLLFSNKPYIFSGDKTRLVLSVALACWLFGSISALISIGHGTHWHIVVPHLTFFIFPFMAWAFLKTPNINGLWLVWGVALGALMGFAYSTHMHFVVGISRATLHGTVISYGNTAVLLAGICWLGLFNNQNQRLKWVLFVAGLAGIGVSLLSGTRGGWLSIVILMLFMWRIAGQTHLARWKWPALGLITAAIMVAALSPKLPINDRIQQAVNDVSHFFQYGDNNTSVGARLAMWEFAASIATEKPILGFGYQGARERWQKAVSSGEYTSAVFGQHFHNEMIERYITTGLIGLGLTLLVYAAGFRVFYSQQSPLGSSINPYATMGVVVLVMYLEFGLFDVVWNSRDNRKIFLFLLMSLVCLAVAKKDTEQP